MHPSNGFWGTAIVCGALTGCTLTAWLSPRVACDDDNDCQKSEMCTDAFCVERPAGKKKDPTPPLPKPVTEMICGEEHVVAPWGYQAYPRRMRIAFCDPTAPDQDVEDFPVVVVLRSPELSAEALRGPILFAAVQDDAAVALSYERTTTSDEQAVFFVRVPRMNPHTKKDSIYVYFHGEGEGEGEEEGEFVDEAENVVGTWQGFSGVWHFDGLEDQQNVEADTFGMQSILGDLPPLSVGVDVDGVAGAFGSAIEIRNLISLGSSFSFVSLPTDLLTSSSGTISFLLAADATAPFEQQGSCGDFGACGDVFFLSEATSGPPGFDQKSLHLTLFGEDPSLGLWRAPRVLADEWEDDFIVDGGLAVPTDSFFVVSVTWDDVYTEIRLSFVGGNGDVSENNAFTLRDQGFFTINRFLLGAAAPTLASPEGRGLVAMYDELQISPDRKDPAYLHAVAMSYLQRLLELGQTEERP